MIDKLIYLIEIIKIIKMKNIKKKFPENLSVRERRWSATVFVGGMR